jgi:hypothetical protein
MYLYASVDQYALNCTRVNNGYATTPCSLVPGSDTVHCGGTDDINICLTPTPPIWGYSTGNYRLRVWFYEDQGTGTCNVLNKLFTYYLSYGAGGWSKLSSNPCPGL